MFIVDQKGRVKKVEPDQRIKHNQLISTNANCYKFINNNGNHLLKYNMLYGMFDTDVDDHDELLRYSW